MQRAKTFTTLGASFLLVSGAFICAPVAKAETETAPKSIRLGVDPDKYLQNRHRRVHQARRAADARASNVAVAQPSSGNEFGGNNSQGDGLALHPDLANRPGFNEFSHLNDDERKNAQEIMQFLKNYQATQTP